MGFTPLCRPAYPVELQLDSRTVLLLSEADRALGRLAGAGRLLPDPHLLVQPYVAREAVASSRIEGTQASLSDVFDATALGAESGDVREVTNYIRALQRGLAGLDRLPISVRLLCEVHEELLRGARGQERLPGEIRRSPELDRLTRQPPRDRRVRSAAGGRHATGPQRLGSASSMTTCRSPRWSSARCCTTSSKPSTRSWTATDGWAGCSSSCSSSNGACSPNRSCTSPHTSNSTGATITTASRPCENADQLEEWVQFFLRGVEVQAADAVRRAEQLADLRERYRQLAARSRSRAGEVVDLVFENPILTPNFVARRLQITPQGALNLIRRLETDGILAEHGRLPGRSKRWIAAAVLDVLEGLGPAT